MTSHADTIREALALPSDHNYASTIARSKMQDEARAALDALLAENQQLEEQRDTALRRIADWQAIAGSAKDENQRLREALGVARPYVYNAMYDRQVNKGWRYQTAVESLRTVDEALAGDAE